MAAQKQLKIARQENAESQTEMLLLMKRIEDMHAEQAYLKELRGGGDDEETDDEEEPTEEKKETPDKK